MLGKREFGQLSPIDLATLLLIPEITSEALMGSGSLVTGLIGVGTILTVVLGMSIIKHLSKPAETAIEGTPAVLVAHGAPVRDTMDNERVGADEVFGAMHRAGIERIAEVPWAILETDGRISIIPEHVPHALSKERGTPYHVIS